MSGCGHEHEDGAYVLGALSSEERTAFEQHLPGCATCSASVRDLAGLPGLLARMPAGVLQSSEPATIPVPDTLLPGLVRRVRRAQRRRTWTLAGIAAGVAAAVVAVVVLGVGLVAGPQQGSPAAVGTPAAAGTTAPPQPLEPVGAEPVSGWISLTSVGWGTRLDLTCSYARAAGAYAEGSTYAMYVTRRDGSTERVASWRALPGRSMHLTGATSADRGDITGVEVRTASGLAVLRLP